jgi:hypothetical protein
MSILCRIVAVRNMVGYEFVGRKYVFADSLIDDGEDNRWKREK